MVKRDSVTKRNILTVPSLPPVLAAGLMVGCGSNSSSGPFPVSSPQAGQIVTFGTDAPICDVESFTATITSASLVPQSGGTAVPLITATAPATVDFARLVDFTNILSRKRKPPERFASVPGAATPSLAQGVVFRPAAIELTR
jgi:hypothetical protein